MALVLKDRVKETTTTTGTGTVNLAGAATGFEGFVSAVGDGSTCYYTILDANGSAWEVGIGTVTDASPDTLSRTTILESSNSDNAITLTSGTHTVFLTYPADKSVYRNTNDQIVATASGIVFSDDTLQTTAASASVTYTAGTGLLLSGTEFNVSGVDTSLLQGTVANNQLANSSVTITAGTGLSNGGSVALGESVSVDIDSSVMQTGDNVSLLTNDAGYLTAYSETGTLQTVTDNGSTTSNAITINDNLTAEKVFADLDGPIVLECKNTTGSQINAGTPVYVSGYFSGNGKALISPAIGNNSSKMPAIGLLESNLSDDTEGNVHIFGLATGFDTSSFSVGETIYVAATGGLTNTRPTGVSDLVQNMGRVLRSDASQGRVLLLGPGRSNDVPNSGNFTELTVDNVSVLTAHPSISGASSVDNSARTYIQDLTLDSNGHVTAIVSAAETVTDTNTTYTAGTGLLLSGTEFNVSGVDTSLLQGTIGSAQIANDAIDSQHYTDGSIDNAHLADDAVNSDELAAGAVDTAHIGDDQVTYAKIQNVSADERILGRVSGANGVIEELTKAQMLTMMNVADGATANVGDITSVVAGTGLSGGGTTGDVTVNVSGVDTSLLQGTISTAQIGDNQVTAAKVAADVATQAELDTVSTVANAALPKAGGAMTGAITTNSTFDGVDIATRDGVLTTTTTTANAALPKAGGAMTGAITTNSTFDGRDVATDGTKLDGIEASATADQTQADINALEITKVGTVATGVWQGTQIATAYIADNAVTLAKLAGGTDGQIITFDANGDPVAVGPGTDGQVLTSTGAGSPPAFEDASGGGVDAANGASDRIATFTDSDSLNGEANLTFDGTDLTIATGSIEVRTIDYSDGDNAVTIADGGAVTFAKSINQAANTATDGGAVDIDCATSNYHEVLMNANATSIVFTNVTAGQRIIVRFKQHSSHIDMHATAGWNTVTVDGSSATVKWGAGVIPTLTESNDAVDVYGFIFESTKTNVMAFIIGQDIK